MNGLITLLFFLGCFAYAFSQEVRHDHSIHHAFLENKGQWPEKVLFKTTFQGGNMWVEQGKVMFHLQDYSEYRSAHAAMNLNAPDVFTFKQTLVHLNFKEQCLYILR